MSTPVTFWYGCNVLRHGDIIHSCLDILRALGYEPSPVGGPDYCCGTTKDANQTTAHMIVGRKGALRGCLTGIRLHLAIQHEQESRSSPGDGGEPRAC